MEFAINLMRVITALVICNTNRKNQNRFENMKDSQGMPQMSTMDNKIIAMLNSNGKK